MGGWRGGVYIYNLSCRGQIKICRIQVLCRKMSLRGLTQRYKVNKLDLRHGSLPISQVFESHLAIYVSAIYILRNLRFFAYLEPTIDN